MFGRGERRGFGRGVRGGVLVEVGHILTSTKVVELSKINVMNISTGFVQSFHLALKRRREIKDWFLPDTS